MCFHDDEVYKPWEKFVSKGCTGWCVCNGKSGSVGCVSLCPPSVPRNCRPGELPETRDVPSGDPTGRCTCKRQSCVERPGFLRRPQLPAPSKLQRYDTFTADKLSMNIKVPDLIIERDGIRERRDSNHVG